MILRRIYLFPPRRMPGFLLVGSAALLLYWPGLGGGFYFDDFAQIVLNPFVQIQELTFRGLLAAASSSVSGPTGRPLAMLSFALDHWLFGLDPGRMKLINLCLHLMNGALLWGMLRTLLPRLPGLELNGKLLASVIAILWLVHPLHVSTVLYTVQRMTLLSASFMLLGLLAYCHFRCRPRSNAVLALGCLFAATGCAVLAKENGALALVYAALIEILVLRFGNLSQPSCKLLKTLFVWLPLVGAVVLLGYVWHVPDWFSRAYAGRDFDVVERLLTEARVLGFYQRLILLPDLSSMGLYHDDWTVSKSLLDPPITAFAILWHTVLLGLAWRLRRFKPVLSFGILWFYASHVLESTVWPLELVFEHRNYLAVVGLLLFLYGALDWVFTKAAASWQGSLAHWVLYALVPLLMAATWVRASDWGDFFGHGVMEAKRHPASARSQFEAGQTLARALDRHPELASQYYLLARDYYWAAARLDPKGLAPLVSLLNLDSTLAHRLDQAVFAELLHRLRHAKPDASVNINLHALNHQILKDESGFFTVQQALAVFDAALANPKLAPRERAEVLVGKALYLNAQGSHDAEVATLLAQASALMPGRLDCKVLLAAKQIDLKRFHEAENTLAEAETLDRFGIMAEEIGHLRQKIQR